MKTFLLILFSFGLVFMACSDGSIPTATAPLQELQAKYVDQRPVLDGIGNEALWEEARPYYVHVVPTEGKNKGQEFNIEFKAVWWKEWAKGKADWNERAYLALLISWPDAEKNIDKQHWEYLPDQSRWQRTNQQSDWLLLQWFSLSDRNDVWYWDAALTNPLGYAEDQYLLISQAEDSTQKASLWIDGLNYLNDTDTEQNTWDLNYDDNLTPRDSTDDKPLWAWVNTVGSAPPTKPRIYSSDDAPNSFLFKSDADFLKNTPYAEPTTNVTVPGYALEEPKDDPADIMAAGNWQDGQWTVELVRSSATKHSNDISFSPDDRYFSQVFLVAIGNNKKSPLESSNDSIFLSRDQVVLSFEYIPPRHN